MTSLSLMPPYKILKSFSFACELEGVCLVGIRCMVEIGLCFESGKRALRSKEHASNAR